MQARRKLPYVAILFVLLSARLFAADPGLATLEPRLTQIVRAARGQVGVSLFHVESGAKLFSFNGHQPFAMASVYKLPIAFELLTQVAEHRLTLDQAVAVGASDIRACCTLSRRHPKGGITITVRDLLELMITESDNTAGDALLKVVGGPLAVDRHLSALGFTGIHVNRSEGAIAFEMMGVAEPPPESTWTLDVQRELIDKVPLQDLLAARARYTTDVRDTATPDDMAAFLLKLQRGELLPPPYTALLLDLLARVKTGPHRLKGRLPPDTVVAHKTGSTAVVINDVGIITLPGNDVDTVDTVDNVDNVDIVDIVDIVNRGNNLSTPGHLALAVFVMNGGRAAAMEKVISDVGAAVYESFTGKTLPPPAKPSRRAAPNMRKRP
jgi:beta-lactamase class A